MDEKSKHSIRAAAWYIISNFISKALFYICTPLYTRVLSVPEYGQYTNFLSWQSILIPLFTFDLSSSVAIAYFDYKDEKSFDGFISTITFFSYLIPCVFSGIILLRLDYFVGVFSIQKEYIIILLIYIMCSNTINVFQAEQRVRLKYKVSSFVTLGTAVASVALTLFLVLVLKNKLLGVLLGSVIVNTIASAILFIRILLCSAQIKLDYLKYALIVAVPLIPHVLAGTILGSADKIMIRKYCGDAQTALYGLSYTISMVVTMIASSTNKAWVPWFFDRVKDGQYRQIKNVSNTITAAISTLCILVCLLGPEILLFAGGKDYVHSAIVMPPIIAACFVNCISTFYINIEFYNKKTSGISIATVLSAIINILLNYIFIQKFGYAAAAYTTLFSSIVSLSFNLVKVKKQQMFDVFDNKILLGSIVVTILISESLLFLYSSVAIRMFLLTVLLSAMGLIAYNKRDILTKTIKLFRER